MKTKQKQMRPLHDFVLVEPVAKQERSPGGIYIPDVAKDKPQRGTILAVGSGRILESGAIVAVSVEPGDVVLFSKYGGHWIDDEGTELMLIRESDLLAIVSEANPGRQFDHQGRPVDVRRYDAETLNQMSGKELAEHFAKK